MTDPDYKEREMALDWGIYYTPGMSSKEAQAFQAGWRAGFDFGSYEAE